MGESCECVRRHHSGYETTISKITWKDRQFFLKLNYQNHQNFSPATTLRTLTLVELQPDLLPLRSHQPRSELFVSGVGRTLTICCLHCFPCLSRCRLLFQPCGVLE
ncbi:hypothetical protein Y1Q_0023393 [Alligator mississippiensis]|uniref:Uncharacterized protein n=1 Tax=Alligator mississippiensis TaxID=8496 RepID=A0A151NPW2_ALLMI|nr:hypothetical protein Y1Q_0023393 [Alligator mississippiensis]